MMFIKQAQLMYKKQGCCGSYRPVPDSFSEEKRAAITALAKLRPGDVTPIEGYLYGWFEATDLDLDAIERSMTGIDGDAKLKALAHANLVLIQHVRDLEARLAVRGELEAPKATLADVQREKSVVEA